MEVKRRYHWLASVINERGYVIGAEIGCKEGIMTSHLLKNCPGLILYAVDMWEYKTDVLSDFAYDVMKDWDFTDIKHDFDTRVEPYTDRLIVLQGVSWEMAESVVDKSLDFVFIDADHGYEPVCKDIEAWRGKLKPEGMLSGHDIHMIGVRRAVERYYPGYKLAGINNVWYEDRVCHSVI